jgi:non-ribosomal peptide synthetase component F
VALAAYAHQNVPFEQVVEAVQPRHDLSYTPLFQVLFVLQNMPLPALEFVGVSSHVLEIESTSTQFDLTLSLEETEEGLQGSLQYPRVAQRDNRKQAGDRRKSMDKRGEVL